MAKHGRHSASRPRRTKQPGSVAIVAIAAGTTLGGGTSGALAATLDQPAETDTLNISLVNDSVSEGTTENPVIASATTDSTTEATHFTPDSSLLSQLSAATAFNLERLQQDLLARLPLTLSPAEGTLSSTFGARWGTNHNGIDIANALGTPIISATAGTVIDAGPAAGYGNWVRVRTDDNYILVYGHMEQIFTQVGARVNAGDEIALMGSEGQSTGPHLHFGVYTDQEIAIDPIPWLQERGVILE